MLTALGLLVMSDRRKYLDLCDLLQPLERRLSRTISPDVLTRRELHSQRLRPDSLVGRIAKQTRVPVIELDETVAELESYSDSSARVGAATTQ